MKVSDLFEMPQYVNKEMPSYGDINLFISEKSIDDLYDKVWAGTILGKTFGILIKKNRKFAVIGRFENRKSDKSFGISVIGKVDFKSSVELSWIKDIEISNKSVLQVDGVSMNEEDRRLNLGSLLYKKLVDVGFVIVSDTLQYIGGRQLWNKLAKEDGKDGSKVFIVADGEVISDEDKPLEYNGKNYSENEIWGPETDKPTNSKKHVLLVLKKI